MIGSLDLNKKKAIIIGGGVSGLLMGLKLKQLDFDFEIHEASAHVGGLIQTLLTPFGPCETAAHSLLVGPHQKEYFDYVKTKLVHVNPKSKARYIVRNGKPSRLPLKIGEIFCTLKSVTQKKSQLSSDATLEQWGNHWVGEAATKWLVTPFVTGVYACAPSDLQFSLAFPDLPNPNQQSLWSAMRPKKTRFKMMAPLYGMGAWIDDMKESLKDHIRYNSKISTLPNLPNVILCVPTSSAATLIQKQDPESATLLQNIRYAPIITTTVFAKKSSFRKGPPQGTGVLIPRNQGYRILGVLYNSSAFPNRVSNPEYVSLTVMLGGTTDREILNVSDDFIRTLLAQDLQKLLGLNEIEHCEITRRENAIPIYNSDLAKALQLLRQNWANNPGQILFSNWTGTVSLRGLINELTTTI